MASTVTELMRRRFMEKGGGEQVDNYIYYDVYVASDNVSREVFSSGPSPVEEMWMDGEQITPVKSMTFAQAGTYHMKVLLKNPTTIPNSALNSGHYRNAVLPACVTYIDTNAFRNYWANSASSTIVCKATIPPTLNGDPFANRHSITVYVPTDSVSAYQTAWTNMANISAII